MTDDERLLDELRPFAFAIAYRLLGSVSEAEDVIQEALLRVHQALQAGEEIASPRAYVATVTSRLGINELRSARARRESYVGEWLPEPIITDGHDDPARHAETADSLSLAMLVLLESLSPEQRAVLLLHDVFDYGHPEIAGIVGKSEDNVRQLATRARRHVEQRRPRFQTTREQRDELATRFLAAAEQGDLAGLEALLAHDVRLTADGGGKAPALAQTLRGRTRVARMLINYWTKLSARIPRMQVRPTEINGSPGALVLDGSERVVGVAVLDIGGDQIQGISAIVNPDKLAHLDPQPIWASCCEHERAAANGRRPKQYRPFPQDNHRNLQHRPTRSHMSTAQETSNKATLMRFHDAMNTGDVELITTTIDELVEPNAVIRTPLPIEATGAQLAKEVFGRLLRAYPDLHITVEDLIEEGDKIVSRNTVTGTHQGEYMGLPPTGKSVTYNEIFIVRFAGGRIAESWGVVDVFSQMKQLGVIPA